MTTPDASSDADVCTEAPSTVTMTVPKIKTQRRKQSPERMHLHHCFNAWLKHPEIGSRYGALTSAMNRHELKSRLCRLLPADDTTPSPMSDLEGFSAAGATEAFIADEDTTTL